MVNWTSREPDVLTGCSPLTYKVLQAPGLLILNDGVLDGLELAPDIRVLGRQVTQGSQYIQCFTKAKSDT